MTDAPSAVDVRSPYSGEVIGQVALASAADMDRALSIARSRFLDRDGWLAPHERIAVLKGAAAQLHARRDELAKLIASEGGKPLVDAEVEVARAVNGVELCAEEVGRIHGEEIPMGLTAASTGRLAFTIREPIGVVAAISAFNHPLNLIVHQVGPAVAAGCPVIVKPSTDTPLSCLVVSEVLAEAGLPEGWVQALVCDNDVAERLVTSDHIAFFSFIGSARVGWALRAKLAPGVRCALEHGGAAPLVVDAAADLDVAASLILKGGYYHAGQVCVSVQRVFADASVADDLVARLSPRVEALRVGDPLSSETEVGPLIRAGEVARVGSWIDEAVAAGATVAAGGQALDRQCYQPTLLVDPPADSKVMQDEVFGPVVSIVSCPTLDEAIDRANDVPWAFQAAIVTQDIDAGLRAARRLDASAVMINDHTAFRVDWMPFGGRGPSGLGMGGMGPAVEELTRLKMIVLRER